MRPPTSTRPRSSGGSRTSGTRDYAKIATELAVVRDLRAAAGQEAAFSAYLAELRQRYGRRPSLARLGL